MQEEIHKRLHAPELGPCVCSQVRRLARKLSSLYDTLLSPEDLTITQYSLLANIERAGQVGHAVLAEKVGMERTTLTRNLPASTNSSRKAEAGSRFAIVGGSTTSISFSDRYRILARTQSASCLFGISRHESFYSRSRKTVTRAITRKNGT